MGPVGVKKVADSNVAHEQTQSNRVTCFRTLYVPYILLRII